MSTRSSIVFAAGLDRAESAPAVPDERTAATVSPAMTVPVRKRPAAERPVPSVVQSRNSLSQRLRRQDRGTWPDLPILCQLDITHVPVHAVTQSRIQA